MDYGKMQIDFIKWKMKEKSNKKAPRAIITQPFEYGLSASEYVMLTDGFVGVWVPTSYMMLDASAFGKEMNALPFCSNVPSLDDERIFPAELTQHDNGNMTQLFRKNGEYFSGCNVNYIKKYFGKTSELKFAQRAATDIIMIYGESDEPLGLVLPIRMNWEGIK